MNRKNANNDIVCTLPMDESTQTTSNKGSGAPNATL